MSPRTIIGRGSYVVPLLMLAVIFSFFSASAGAQAPTGFVTGNVNVSVVAGYQLIVNKTGTGSGTVSSSPEGINCGSACSVIFANGTNITLTATADSNSTFSGWGGDCSGTGTCNLTMSSNKSANATFTLVEVAAPPARVGEGAPIPPEVVNVSLDFALADSFTQSYRERQSFTIMINSHVKSFRIVGNTLIVDEMPVFVTHKLTISELLDNGVRLTIESSPRTYIIPIGGTEYIDFEGDNDPDLKITLAAIKSNAAVITLQSLRVLSFLSYPGLINITQGESGTYAVTLQNFGVKPQQDVYPSLLGFPYPLNITPVIIGSLESKSVATYLLSIYIPPDAEARKYRFVLRASSASIAKERGVDMNLFGAPKKPALEIFDLGAEIARMGAVLEQAFNSAYAKQRIGYDIGNVLSLLRAASRSLDAAAEASKAGDNEKALNLLNEAKELTKKAVLALAESKNPLKEVLIYVGIVLAGAFVAALVLTYARTFGSITARQPPSESPPPESPPE